MSRIIHNQLLNDTGGTLIDSYSVASGAVIRTNTINTERSTGFSSLLLLIAGTITAVQEVSFDGTTFYSPVDASNTDVSSLASSAAADRWISFSPQLAPFTRFVFTGNSTSTITAQLIFQEDNK